ncbi:MAG TPA: biotin/lipoyl-containing protein [Bacillota bacterium]|nr:biotin/lipoyl-containing protein [Bacillota bacterium]
MKKFRITVNGEAFEVEVEETGVEGNAPHQPVARAAASVSPVAPRAAAPAAAPRAAAPAAKPAASGPAGAGSATAPMPGTILDVKVSVGDQVKAGQTVVILEAMKMENEIGAPIDGTVKEVRVQKGATVNPGDVLVTIG